MENINASLCVFVCARRNKNACVKYIYARVCAAARVFNVYESAGAMFLISLPACHPGGSYFISMHTP
jgi:hypothetical protein